MVYIRHLCYCRTAHHYSALLPWKKKPKKQRKLISAQHSEYTDAASTTSDSPVFTIARISYLVCSTRHDKTSNTDHILPCLGWASNQMISSSPWCSCKEARPNRGRPRLFRRACIIRLQRAVYYWLTSASRMNHLVGPSKHKIPIPCVTP